MRVFYKMLWNSAIIALASAVVLIGVVGSIELSEHLGGYWGIPLIGTWIVFGMTVFIQAITKALE